MTHDEYLFLHLQCGIVASHAARAAAEGETFHALPVFTPLRSGVQARAERVEGGLRLYVRHAAAASEPPAVATAFRAFFPEGFDREASHVEGGWRVHSARGGDVPTPFTGASHDHSAQVHPQLARVPGSGVRPSGDAPA